MASEPLLEKYIAASAHALLMDDSGCITFRGKKVCLVLTASAFGIYDFETKAQKELVSIADLLGATCPLHSNPAVSKLEVVAYPRSSGNCMSCTTTGERERVVYSFAMSVDIKKSEEWLNKIQQLSRNDSLEDRIKIMSAKRKYLVFINPISGKGQALSIWNEFCKQMFDDANVGYDVIVTTHANHATEFMEKVDHSLYSALMIIGGDGLLSEVVNGIHKRADWKEVFARLPLCPVPGGSGNGLAKSILFAADEEFSVQNAVFVSLKGRPLPLDLTSVQTKSKSFNGFLMYAWGLISDIDIKSEAMRCLGEMRFYVAAVYFILRKHMYRAKVSLLLESSSSSNGDSSGSVELPPINQPLDTSSDNWLVLEGEFVLFMAVNSTHCSSSMYSCPSAKLSSELFSIILIQDVSRLELIDIMIGFDTGEHVKHPKVKQYKARAYRLEPQGAEDGAVHSLDGEIVEYGPIQASILPGIANILTTELGGNGKTHTQSPLQDLEGEVGVK